MDTTFETELILKGLYRDRDELSAKLSDVEKLIKKIKAGTFALNTIANNTPAPTQDTDNTTTQISFPFKAEFKFQIIAVIDILGVACKLKDMQEKYKEITGSTYPIRETLRTLHKHKVLKMLRSKDGDRGVFWVKRDWLENDGTKLKDKHKFYGFDVLYPDETIEFD